MMKASITHRKIAMATLLAALIIGASGAQAEGFAIKDTAGVHLDVTYDGKTVARYMYAFDKSTEETLHETYKPYLHIFDAEGKAPITKGSGGQYTHHRGIFIGFNKIGFEGNTYDLWHMKGVYQIHQRFEAKESTNWSASITSRVHWIDPDGKVILDEVRSMAFRKPRGGVLLVDFTSTLTAASGDVELNGDPEHAGIQYRPSDEVDRAATVYAFPKENADPKADRDYPWVGETYTLNGKQYSVVHINHPDNPKDTIYSAYRDYGRFGAFFVEPIEKGESLTVNYRFLVREGALPSVETIEAYSKAFPGSTRGLPAFDAPGTAPWNTSAQKK